MMTSLFSWFDPISSFKLHLNWLAIFLPLFLIPQHFYILPSRFALLWSKVLSSIHSTSAGMLGKPSKSILIVSVFIFISSANLLSLLPYVFAPSSHLTLTLSLALPIWFCAFFYMFSNHFRRSMAHLVPEGTPTVIMPFMVVIELISLIIRPFTLAVRLAANMTAGHLLTILLGTALSLLPLFLNPYLSTLIPFLGFPLLILETAVAIIQAVVFIILLSLYLAEAQ
uniref:ATP synthase subunit a n=1 Tax=Rhynchocinetes durbanensis TaxID=516932 RepID=A0A0X9V369_9EUCA|nr:ATP synthase F0 subunit 6 [Rhynchocinetes durbanensis]AMA20510.1 ATP synthase F0 subunit 6 [Rhynchocinetes durbanensis]